MTKFPAWRNPFTAHPKIYGESYTQHGWFALAIGAHLALSATCFLAHAVLPMVPIPRRYNLTAMVSYLKMKSMQRAGRGKESKVPSSSRQLAP